MLSWFEAGDVVLRLLAAALFAGAIGWEREASDKPAGLRTNILVALGAAAFTLISLRLGQAFAPELGESANFDPTRAVQGVIGGIGFLGAGAIIQSRGAVHGLTTAAAMWVVGAIGLACGAGFFGIAALVAACTLLVLYPLGYLERRWSRLAAPAQEVSSQAEA